MTPGRYVGCGTGWSRNWGPASVSYISITMSPASKFIGAGQPTRHRRRHVPRSVSGPSHTVRPSPASPFFLDPRRDRFPIRLRHGDVPSLRNRGDLSRSTRTNPNSHHRGPGFPRFFSPISSPTTSHPTHPPLSGEQCTPNRGNGEHFPMTQTEAITNLLYTGPPLGHPPGHTLRGAVTCGFGWSWLGSWLGLLLSVLVWLPPPPPLSPYLPLPLPSYLSNGTGHCLRSLVLPLCPLGSQLERDGSE